MLAAETRKQVAQCANTGISAIIDERGVILQKTNWWEAAVITGTLTPSNTVTFYAAHGDYLGFCACVLSALLLCSLLALRVRRLFQKETIS